MTDGEFEEIKQGSAASGQTISEWVRTVLRQARLDQASSGLASRLTAIRAATAHSFPTGDIDDMIDEIEAGSR
jgi:hypothetical protein